MSILQSLSSSMICCQIYVPLRLLYTAPVQVPLIRLQIILETEVSFMSCTYFFRLAVSLPPAKRPRLQQRPLQRDEDEVKVHP